MAYSRKKLPVAVFALLFAVATISAMSPTAASGATPPATPASLPTLPVGPSENDIQQLRAAVDKSPDKYAGISTSDRSAIVVHVVGAMVLDAQIDTAVTSLRAKGASVSVRSERYSARQLQAVVDQVPVSKTFGPASSGLSTWSFEPDLNAVQVGVVSVTPQLASASTAEFGGLVKIVSAPRFTPAGRLNDSPPLWGGDRITGGPSGNNCTSGFAALDINNTIYMVTAGHCYKLGTSVSANTHLSSVARRSFNNLNPDEELLGNVSPAVYTNPGSGIMWEGSMSTQSSRAVTDSVDSCTGCQVYFGGSYTGKSLATLKGSKGGTRECIDSPSCNNFVNITNVQEATGQSGICQHGDSGGPVYAFNSSGVTAVGIITSIAIKNGSEDTHDCFYTSFPDILNKEGLRFMHG